MHSILKFVFLEILNKAIRPVLSGPVTYTVKYLIVSIENLKGFNCNFVVVNQ